VTHRHLDQGELLDGWLATGALPERARACAHCRAAGLELGDWLAGLRAAARDEEPAASPGLVARVLARTTGEDLALRGDLWLLADFVRQRLAASRFLRLAAASLLVHLLALPVFAWLALRPAPTPSGFRAHLELREQALPAVPQEPARELDLPPLPEPFLMEVAGEGPALRRRLEREHLLAAPPPEGPARGAGAAEDGVERLLGLRARGLRGALDASALASAAPERPTALERVLWVEVLMDHLVLAGERLPALEVGLARLGTASALPQVQRRLEVLALERAEGLGLLDPAGRERWRSLAGPVPAEPRAPGARGFGRALAAALGERAGSWADWDR